MSPTARGGFWRGTRAPRVAPGRWPCFGQSSWATASTTRKITASFQTCAFSAPIILTYSRGTEHREGHDRRWTPLWDQAASLFLLRSSRVGQAALTSRVGADRYSDRLRLL